MTATFLPLQRVRAFGLLVAFVCGLMVVGLRAVSAQPPVMSGGPAAPVFQRLVAGGDPVLGHDSFSGHGWAFVPAPGSTDGYLVHFVPRQAVLRASAGSVRLVMALNRSPLAIAGWEGEAILLLGPPGDDAVSPQERTVSSLKAVGPVSFGNWDYRPAERLELKAALPSDTVPRSMVGSSLGPVLVWERGASKGGTLEIVVLDDTSTWHVLQPPPGFPASALGAEAHVLTSAPGGVLVACRVLGDPVLTLWRGAPDLGVKPAKDALPAPLPTVWENVGTARLPGEFLHSAVRTMGVSAGQWLWRDAGSTLLATMGGDAAGGGMTLWRLDATEPLVLWRGKDFASPPKSAGALVMGGLDAVTVLSYDPAPSASAQRSARGGGSGRDAASLAPEAGRLRVVEVSSSTGAQLADLPAHTDGFLSRNEMWILWMLFIGVGVVILWVVMSIDGPMELQLPDGTALASPLRRVVAGGIDVLLAVGVTSAVVGSTPSHWLSPATSTSASMLPLLSVIGLGFLMGTLGEATLGCSPGKLLTGVRVLGLAPLAPVKVGAGSGASKKTDGKPVIWHVTKVRLYQAVLRNAVRWFMPPVGVMMIADYNLRHPGDLLARTVVVVRVDPEEEEPPVDEGNES